MWCFVIYKSSHYLRLYLLDYPYPYLLDLNKTDRQILRDNIQDSIEPTSRSVTRRGDVKYISS